MISTTFHTIHHNPFDFEVEGQLFVDDKVVMGKDSKFIYMFFFKRKKRNEIREGIPHCKERGQYLVVASRVIC